MAGDDEQPPLPPPKREMNSPFFSQETDQATSSLPLAYVATIMTIGLPIFSWHWRHASSILEGTITGPQPSYTQSDWNTVNAMLVSWITNTIDPEVKSTLSKFRDAKRLWEHLKQRYAMVNGPRIQQLKTSIAKREQGKLHDFLMGLNTDLYAQLRTNILSQDPLPSLDRAIHEDKPTEVLGFAVRQSGRGRGKMERPVCSHCKKTGHETSTCWSLVACPHRHKHGHDKNNCYEIVGYPEGGWIKTRLMGCWT
ncbi:hypothetical protein AAG906_011242 [Vitis piasezkii]